MAVDFVKAIGVLSALNFFLLFFPMHWRYIRHVDLSGSMLARLWVEHCGGGAGGPTGS